MKTNANVQRRGERVTKEQKRTIVEFMEEHLEFARGKLLSVEGKITTINLWQVLCQQLDSIGPKKNVGKWQRVWTDMKIGVKRKAKASRNTSSRQKTGGGPPEDIILDEMEEKIIQIISQKLDSEKPVPPSVQTIAGDRSYVHTMPRVPQREQIPDEPLVSCSSGNGNEPPAKKRSVQWTSNVKEEENRVLSEQITNNFDPLSSPASSDVSTSQRSRNRRGVAAAAAEEPKDLSRQSTEALQKVGAELKRLNENVSLIINQNEKIMLDRRETNTILLRIAQALEGQKIDL